MTTGKPEGEVTRPWHIIDLFAGPGGLDVAAKWLDIPACGIEWDKNAVATRRKAALKTEQGDVRAYGPRCFPEATVLAGGPPCQTFTVAGRGAGRQALDEVLALVGRMAAGEDVLAKVSTFDDERTGLVLEPLRWALDAQRAGHPYRAIILEQVPAVLPVWRAMGEVLAGLGYFVDHGILRTEEYGVPQTRRRAVLVARLDEQPLLPSPTHRPFRRGAPEPMAASALLPCVTMAEALDRKDPFTVVSNYGTGGDPRVRGRRHSHEPAATVTGKVRRNRLIGQGLDPDARLSLDDAGRLQTFPPGYPWRGGDIAQQIGNAIPPRLAAHVLASALGMSLNVAALDVHVTEEWTDAASRLDISTPTALDMRELLDASIV